MRSHMAANTDKWSDRYINHAIPLLYLPQRCMPFLILYFIFNYIVYNYYNCKFGLKLVQVVTSLKQF
jgi:hypothetical protein